jgi:(1->4)-alpha-D-glucan 1-alpha-D-glucosylmutase
VKQLIVARALALRRRLPQVFLHGSYEPLPVAGAMARHVVAYARRAGSDAVVVVAPRLPSALVNQADTLALAPTTWKDTSLELPEMPLFDVLQGSGRPASAEVRDILAALPVALFSTRES